MKAIERRREEKYAQTTYLFKKINPMKYSSLSFEELSDFSNINSTYFNINK